MREEEHGALMEWTGNGMISQNRERVGHRGIWVMDTLRL